MTAGKARAAKPALDAKAVIDAQRVQLFTAAAISRVCAIACTDELTDDDDLLDALQHVAAILDKVAEALEAFAGEAS